MKASIENTPFVSPAEEERPIFSRAVVAASFSPRLTAVLNEAARILTAFGAEVIVVHAADEPRRAEERLRQAVASSELAERNPRLLVGSADADDLLLRVAAEEKADLIIAGALAKEGLFRYYLGSVARNLARQASCSVLLLTEPQEQPKSFNRIHCAVDYSAGADKAPRVAAQIALAVGSRQLFFTHAFESPELKSGLPDAETILQIYRREDQRLAAYLAALNLPFIGYQQRCLHDPDHHLTLGFTRDLEADLLIFHGPADRFSLWNRFFHHDLDAALHHLPCSLLLTR